MLAVTAVVLAGCALRPRYADFVKPGSQPTELKLQVLDSDTGNPVPGTKIDIGERARIRAVTDAQGMFVLPVEQKYSDENALVVVNLPKGVRGYRLVAVKPAAVSVPETPEVPALEADAADAGVTSM